MRRADLDMGIIKESISQALIMLMSQTAFEKINVTDIVQKAGVSRVSFYRNYKSKEDVLVDTMNKVTLKWWETINTYTDNRRIKEIFIFCHQNKDFFLLLYRHNLSHLLYQALSILLSVGEDDQSPSQLYQMEMQVGCVYGLLNHWIKNNMDKTAEEIYLYLKNSEFWHLFAKL